LRPRAAVILALAVAVTALIAGAGMLFSWLTMAQSAANSLGRGINFGNMLEAPLEGDWGLRLDEEFFARAKEAGFDTVRLPVRWSNHAAATAPYTIDDTFFQRVDWAIDQASRRDLKIVVNLQHYRQLDGDPLDRNERPVAEAVLEERFVALWKQIADRYAGVDSRRLFFELYNEPHRRLTPQAWNRLARSALETVRQSNPLRPVLIGPDAYDKAEFLKDLDLPFFDRRIIVTTHLYDPYPFTHQGAPWVEGSEKWLNTRCCSDEQRDEIESRLDTARNWSRWHLRPIWIGEFGSYDKADYASRVRYTRLARRAIEAHGFGWAYWDLASQFGIYDPGNRAWRTELRDALLREGPIPDK
jgi:endoglucanase